MEDLERLLTAGADIDARDRYGQTALMLAASQGSAFVVGWLIENGAALDHTAKYGLSALMLAVIRGHVDVVWRLVNAGANISLQGAGASGFAGKTALDLATARADAEMIQILTTPVNRRFETASSWNAARHLLTFEPRKPKYTAGYPLQSIRIHVRDHKLRELPAADRTLEAHYGPFVVSQARRTASEARRLALEVSYGRDARDAEIAGCAARVYDAGPEPEPGDFDGRSPAVVVWRDGEMFYLIASDEMPPDTLVTIATSLYV
jgi:uncharacterized protein